MSEEEILNLKVMVSNLDLSINSQEKLFNQINKISLLLQQKENIIKEVREYIEENIKGNYFKRYDDDIYKACDDILEIIDKENK